MPTYDYKCLECNYAFEEFQSMSDDPIDVCPVCKGNVKRLIGTGAAPIFKGSGFYQTDYKNSSQNNMASKNSQSNKKEGASTSVKKDTSSKNLASD